MMAKAGERGRGAPDLLSRGTTMSFASGGTGREVATDVARAMNSRANSLIQTLGSGFSRGPVFDLRGERREDDGTAMRL